MKKAVLALLVVVLVASALPAAAGSRARSNVDPPIISWQPPATYSMAPAGGRTALAEIGGGPAPFYPVTPCRQYDSRNTTALLQATPRTVTLSGAPCGIPSTTNAVAVNITVFNITGATGNGVFKVDTVLPPTIAWINYPPTETQRGNAGVVSVSGGALVVEIAQGAGSVDFVVDVFGYYYNGNVLTLMPTGDYFAIRGDYTGGSVLYAANYQASGASSFGVGGVTLSTGAGSAGVAGFAAAATGTVYGVEGAVVSTTDGGAGVYGSATGITGANYGVEGTNDGTSNNSAGVYGLSGTAPSTIASYFRSGVRGDAGGTLSYGVLGIAQYGGVVGLQVDSLGIFVRGGRLGYLTYGVYSQGDFGGTGAKYFVEPHAVDAKKVIKYIALEGPESGTYFRGRARFAGKVAVIQVPEDFRMVTDSEGLTVHVTPIGRQASAWVTSMDLNEIVIESTRDVEFSYIVHGVRKAFKGFQPIQEGDEFAPEGPNDRLPRYLTEEASQRLISNGTYNADGTVNMQTAERVGWANKWREEERLRKEAASRAAGRPERFPLP